MQAEWFYLPIYLYIFFFFFFFFLQLAERNLIKTGHMLGSECDYEKVCPKSGVDPLHKTPFSTTLQLNGNFNGLYLPNETWYIIEQVRWKLQGVSYTVSKCLKPWSTIGLKLDQSFYPPSVNSALE